MKYFAIIDGEQRGPYSLNEMREAGVMPQTYVWCKDMERWQQAKDVADICRYYRQRLFELSHPSVAEVDKIDASGTNNNTGVAGADGNASQENGGFFFARNFGVDIDELNSEKDYQQRVPKDMRLLAVASVVFLFFPTGLGACYYAWQSRRLWNKYCSLDSGSAEGDVLARMAHNYCRLAKMLVGISFFLGIINYATVISTFL